MTQSVPSLAIAAAAALVLFGCDELGRGPADPKPPKAAAASVLPDTPLRTNLETITPVFLPR